MVSPTRLPPATKTRWVVGSRDAHWSVLHGAAASPHVSESVPSFATNVPDVAPRRHTGRGGSGGAEGLLGGTTPCGMAHTPEAGPQLEHVFGKRASQDANAHALAKMTHERRRIAPMDRARSNMHTRCARAEKPARAKRDI